MLRSEAIRLIFRQEQNHELNDTNHQPVAPTLARRHADAQTLPQDTERLYPHREPLLWLAGPLARQRKRRKIAALSVAPGRSRHLAYFTQRHDYRTQVFLREHARSHRVNEAHASGACAAQDSY